MADAHGAGDRLLIGSRRPARFKHDNAIGALQVERRAGGVDLQDGRLDDVVLNSGDDGAPLGVGSASVDSPDCDALLG